MKFKQQSIGREAANNLFKSGWWKDRTPREIAEFSLLTEELCVPFHIFHESIEKALGRPVFTHEFALNIDGICDELFNGKPAPTFEQIINLIPADKRVLVAL